MSLGNTYFQTVRRHQALVAYWRLNDPSGATIALDWGLKYGLDGFFNGSPAPGPPLIQADIAAGSLQFGSAGLNGQVADISALHLLGDITIEAWIAASAAGQTIPILGKMNAGGTVPAPYALGLNAGMPYLAQGNGTTSTRVTSSVAPITRIPSHVVGTSFRGALAIYLNGAVVGTTTLGAQTVTDAAQPLYIGAIGAATGYNGLVGEIALYSGALSARAVARHFALGQQVLSDPAHIKTVDPPVMSL